ncbi:MAG: glycosyltransferase family 4 protein [Candidatus Acidiferrales bacterium]
MRKPTILFVITRPTLAGAQVYLVNLMAGLQNAFSFHLATGRPGWLTEKALALGVPVSIVPGLVEQIAPLADLRAVRGLTRLMQQLRPDLVSAHSTKAGLLGRLAARWAGVPVVIFTAHGWLFTEGTARWRRLVGPALERWAARHTTKIICVSEYDRQLALRYRIAAGDKLATIRNGINPEPYLHAADESVRRELGVGDKRLLITVARLEPQKAPLTLLKALRELPGQGFVLLWVGDGPLRRQVEQFASENGLQQRVIFTGERVDIPSLLASAEMFVLPSQWEGLPLVVIEAMFAGLPVVATRVGGVSELVEDGKTGLLVPPGDSVALTRAIRQLLDDRALAQRMGRAGRERALKEFTLERMLSETQRLYEDLLRSGPQ